MKFRYNFDKNSQLIKERGIGFEEIITAIAEGNLLIVSSHHNIDKYPNQKILFVRLLMEIYVVPCVIEEDGTFFMKTLFPSRKARKILLSKN